MIQRFRGHSPIIHPAARLAANATLVGCVTVEAASSIWYGAVLRQDHRPDGRLLRHPAQRP